jgi:hypothetical protein
MLHRQQPALKIEEMGKLMAVAPYRELLTKGEGIVVANSVYDQIWRDY